MSGSRDFVWFFAISFAILGGSATAQPPTPGERPMAQPPTQIDVTSPGTGGPSQAQAAVSAPTEIQREQAGTAPSETNFLARFLRIDDSPVKVYGWLDNSFTGNTNGTPRNDQNFSVFPNHLANRWQGNQ
jgi:hypothetical protein